MSEDVYRKLAKVLDTLPNGFPETEDGVEIKILKFIFAPEEAGLFCDLRMSYETPEQIAKRTGRPLEGLTELLLQMWDRGQIYGLDFGEMKLFKMAAWIFGIYEFQLKRMTKELAMLCKEYEYAFGSQFFAGAPQFMQVLPVEAELKDNQEPMPYNKISQIIDNGVSFGLSDCICKKEHELLDDRCDKPMEVCLSIAPVPDFFDDHPLAVRTITKEEAYEVLKISEEAGLVHMTSNVASGQFYICNCCGCCCGVLRSMNQYEINDSINTSYIAKIDGDACISCGVCKDDRCQVMAIAETDDVYSIVDEKCIGCGLCISTCPVDAITLEKKSAEELTPPPQDENEWNKKRAEFRGVDFSEYA